jgi:UDP-N-acetyl-D-glucosamine dehydrogenase
VRRLIDALNTRGRAVSGTRILLLGLAYKKNTGDARESPSVRVVQLLTQMGADVRAVDPHVVEPVHGLGNVNRVEFSVDEVRGADVVVLLADHDEFDYEMIAREASFVFDTRHRLSGPNIEAI